MSFISISPPPTPSGPVPAGLIDPGILAPSSLVAILSALLNPQTGSLTHLVQSLSVLLSASATGASLSLSFFLVPRLLESPTPLMLTQWRRTYEQTFSTLNRAGAAAALGYLLLAWRFGVRYSSEILSGGRGMQALKLVKRGRMYAVAGALLVLGMAPYGWVVLGGVERRLVARAEAVERAMRQKGVDVEVGELGGGGSSGGLKRRQSVRGKGVEREKGREGSGKDGMGKGKEREKERERDVEEEDSSRKGDDEVGLGEKVDMKAVEVGAKYWVDQWGVLNLGRAAMIAASAVMGLSASLWN
ncbi:hypothetical protein NEUTE2DRAFT_78435 [Neurospora tetrasperma FGSC 2509]|nr:hypothetical protein NEUTE2DRAFT_78435 [Neurospora tetrasperma FGSC 2509]